MSAYLILAVQVHDPQGHQAYRKAGPATLEAFGGNWVVRGREIAVLEGDWRPNRIVVVEFPDLDAAKRWYASDAYQAATKRREHTPTVQAVAVEAM